MVKTRNRLILPSKCAVCGNKVKIYETTRGKMIVE